ncbi:MAG TPA: hypothetical protein DC048_12260 [Planctomycetaceae bacterium]|nr:hypothetical protein [Planctomycetaceae bacterium]
MDGFGAGDDAMWHRTRRVPLPVTAPTTRIEDYRTIVRDAHTFRSVRGRHDPHNRHDRHTRGGAWKRAYSADRCPTPSPRDVTGACRAAT